MTTNVTTASARPGDWIVARGVGDRPTRRGEIIQVLGEFPEVSFDVPRRDTCPQQPLPQNVKWWWHVRLCPGRGESPGRAQSTNPPAS